MQSRATDYPRVAAFAITSGAGWNRTTVSSAPSIAAVAVVVVLIVPALLRPLGTSLARLIPTAAGISRGIDVVLIQLITSRDGDIMRSKLLHLGHEVHHKGVKLLDVTR